MSLCLSICACVCETEMQKTDYKLFAGRQYLLGDNCQVTLHFTILMLILNQGQDCVCCGRLLLSVSHVGVITSTCVSGAFGGNREVLQRFQSGSRNRLHGRHPHHRGTQKKVTNHLYLTLSLTLKPDPQNPQTDEDRWSVRVKLIFTKNSETLCGNIFHIEGGQALRRSCLS